MRNGPFLYVGFVCGFNNDPSNAEGHNLWLNDEFVQGTREPHKLVIDLYTPSSIPQEILECLQRPRTNGYVANDINKAFSSLRLDRSLGV